MNPYLKFGLAVARPVLDLADRWVAQTVQLSEAHGRLVACVGCRLGHCCRHPVMADVLDAVGIAAGIVECGENTRHLRRQLRNIGEAHERALVEWIIDNEECLCPFLTDGVGCSVYDARPVACRVYLVLHTRDHCTPYWSRRDGAKPCVSQINTGEIVGTAGLAAIRFQQHLGWPYGAHLRCLPAQVAAWLEAAASSASSFWAVLRDASAMPPEKFFQIAEHQRKRWAHIVDRIGKPG